MKMPLNRFNSLLQDKKHNDRKSQLPLTGEILRSHAMAGNEICVAKFTTQCFEQLEERAWNRFNNALHLQGIKSNRAEVQLNNSPNTCKANVNQCQWQWGGALGL